MTNSAVRIGRAAALGCALSCLPSAGFAIGSDAASGDAASTTCLASPKGAAPKGERWLYRIDRSTKKQCWYTRAATTRDVAARKSPPTPREPVVDVADDTPPAPMQPALANARAEAPPPADTPAPVVTPPPVAADTANRILADRFADLPDANRPVQSRPVPATPLPAAPASQSATDQSDLFWLLICIIGGVIGLVGLTVGAIRHFTQGPVASLPDDHWEQTSWRDGPASEPPPAHNDDPPSMTWLHTARDYADRRSDEIHKVLSRRRRAG